MTAIDAARPGHPDTGDRGEDDDGSGALRAQYRSERGQHADVGVVVGVGDLKCMRHIGFGASLVAEDAERDDRDPDRPVSFGQRRDQRWMAVGVVRVEGDGVYLGCTGIEQSCGLGHEVVGTAGRQDDGPSGCEARRGGDADLAAAAEQHEGTGRVGVRTR